MLASSGWSRAWPPERADERHRSSRRRRGRSAQPLNLATLPARIEELAAADVAAAATRRARCSPSCARALSTGAVRAAEPDARVADRLAREHLGEAGHPARLPLRRRSSTCRRITAGCRSSTRTRCRSSSLTLEAGVRIVPGGSAVRDGAYVAPGVICMPPMYINIGAYVGEGTLIDSHALVGSCAQIGARVHVSAGRADRRRDRAGRRAAGDHRRRGAGRRQHRHLRGRGDQGAAR